MLISRLGWSTIYIYVKLSTLFRDYFCPTQKADTIFLIHILLPLCLKESFSELRSLPATFLSGEQHGMPQPLNISKISFCFWCNTRSWDSSELVSFITNFSGGLPGAQSGRRASIKMFWLQQLINSLEKKGTENGKETHVIMLTTLICHWRSDGGSPDIVKGRQTANHSPRFPGRNSVYF